MATRKKTKAQIKAQRLRNLSKARKALKAKRRGKKAASKKRSKKTTKKRSKKAAKKTTKRKVSAKQRAAAKRNIKKAQAARKAKAKKRGSGRKRASKALGTRAEARKTTAAAARKGARRRKVKRGTYEYLTPAQQMGPQPFYGPELPPGFKPPRTRKRAAKKAPRVQNIQAEQLLGIGKGKRSAWVCVGVKRRGCAGGSKMARLGKMRGLRLGKVVIPLH